MKNRKGGLNIEIIVIIIFALTAAIHMKSFTDRLKSNVNTYNENVKYTEQALDTYIAEIEEVGYLSLSIKAKITNDISDKFSLVEIEGSPEKVDTGEDVVIIVKVSDQNIRGGTIRSTTLTKTGKAK